MEKTVKEGLKKKILFKDNHFPEGLKTLYKGLADWGLIDLGAKQPTFINK